MKPKILVFIDWYLPGYKAGGPTRSVANITDHLSEDYQFLIVTRDTDYCESIPYAHVKSDNWNQLAPHVSVYYFSDENLRFSNIKKLIAHTEFDLAYITGLYSKYFSLWPAFLFRKARKKIVLAPRGMLSDQTFASSKWKKKIFLPLVKFLKLYNKIVFQATNDQEKQDIKKHLGRVKIIQAPNLPKKARNNQKRIITKKPSELRLVNIARIAPEKNNLFAIQQLAKMSGQTITLDLYGPIYNQDYWSKCQKLMDRLPASAIVTYHGPIDPDEIENILPKYHFLFFPSTGENFGHAIYESLVFGIPVLVSDQTPWRNLSQKSAGWDLPLHQPERWQDILRKCYDMKQEEYDKLCNGANALALDYIEKSNFKEQYKELFEI